MKPGSTSLTLPNNIRVEYGYDAASKVRSITCKHNRTTGVGDLTYEYDTAINRTKIGRSWAMKGMPEPVSSTNDDNGILQSITDSNGTPLYQWIARNQLIGSSWPSVNAICI